MIRDHQLGPDSLAMELASNDGYLLQFYREAGVPVLGIEPAGNIARIARERGIDTRCLFFNEDAATALEQEGVAADVLHANNVLAHVADLHSFVAGIAIVLKPTGIAVIEVPYLCDMISGGEFDTIYHEHLCYFSLIALRSLMARHGLAIVDVEHLPIHGGSLRLFIRHTTTQTSTSDSVDQMIAEEQALGIDRINYYRDFAREVETLRDQLTALLQQRKQQGRRIVAYGASAKGSTLLNCFGIGRDILDYIVDRNDHKQGQLAPGTHLPIVHPDQLLTDQPDDVLLLTWNFRDEILAQQAEYRRRGGRFIIPIPKLEIV
jgi:SAM-dependent methyltransferase